MIDIDVLFTCLRQRVILLTEIMDVSKQIEVRSKQNDINLDELLSQRKNCMDRVDKCNQLIKKQFEDLPEEEKNDWICLVNGQKKNRLTKDEIIITELSRNYLDLLKESIKINTIAFEYLKEKKEDLQKHINKARKASDKKGEMLFEQGATLF